MRYGHFDDINREYVIERVDTPASWTNYLGLEKLCTVIAHHGGGYSFYDSAEKGRITRFRANSVPLDRPGHYVYLRDDDDGDFWSISWQPVGRDLQKADYQCRHGLSYTKFICRYKAISAKQTMFIPLGDDVQLWDVRLTNNSRRNRRISVFSYVEFSLHDVRLDSQDFQMGLYAAGSGYKDGIIDYNFFYAPGVHHFFASSFKPDSFDCLRDSFIGTYNSESNPAAVQRGKCSGSYQNTGNHCGALHKRFTIKPGQDVRFVFMLGVGNVAQARKIRKKYSNLKNVDKAYSALRKYWHDKLSVLQCSTPDAGTNTMLNTWNIYQAETCIVWSRFASFIEVGGRSGLGYRDTAQDAMSVVHTNPARAKERMRQLLAGQTKAGFGLHLFEPDLVNPSKDGGKKALIPTVVISKEEKLHIPALKDVCSDDVLWLVVTVCEYVKETGDVSFFDEPVSFADGGSATVYEHLKRALDFSARQVGPDGICRGLRADWNDCINLKGGQSAMVSFMHYWAMNAFAEAAQFLGRKNDVRRYRGIMEKVKKACNRRLWDGKWFIRGITAEARKIGTIKDRQGRIFLNAQSWAVMSSVAEGKRARMCMDAAYKYLFSKYGLHLLWPAYTRADDSIGFITRVYPGIKENASIFTHPNPWAMIAECMLGRGRRAFEYYSATLPYNQNDIIETRQAEPYSYCQFVMGKDHTGFGCARHPWLTGSSGWLYTAATKWMLGVRPTFNGLVIDPCIPPEWDGFEVVRKWRGATYRILVDNHRHVQKGIKSITMNGRKVCLPIKPRKEGTVNNIEIVMG